MRGCVCVYWHGWRHVSLATLRLVLVSKGTTLIARMPLLRPRLAGHQAIRIFRHARQTMTDAPNGRSSASRRAPIGVCSPILNSHSVNIVDTEAFVQVLQYLIASMIAAVAVGSRGSI